MPKKFVQEIVKTITDTLPEGIKDAHSEVERKIKEGVEKAVSNVRFVKEEDFELQQKILMRTREKVDQLEEKVAKIEELLQQKFNE